MNRTEVTCAACGRVFVPSWSEEDKKKEYRDNFGYVDDVDLNSQGLATVCSFCYDLIMAAIKQTTTNN